MHIRLTWCPGRCIFFLAADLITVRDLRKTERKCSAMQKSINKGVEVAEGKGDSLHDNRGVLMGE